MKTIVAEKKNLKKKKETFVRSANVFFPPRAIRASRLLTLSRPGRGQVLRRRWATSATRSRRVWLGYSGEKNGNGSEIGIKKKGERGWNGREQTRRQSRLSRRRKATAFSRRARGSAPRSRRRLWYLNERASCDSDTSHACSFLPCVCLCVMTGNKPTTWYQTARERSPWALFYIHICIGVYMYICVFIYVVSLCRRVSPRPSRSHPLATHRPTFHWWFPVASRTSLPSSCQDTSPMKIKYMSDI